MAMPGTAAANNSPVHIDPSSPVAKEYALPIAIARGAPSEQGKSSRLFGSGIKPNSAPVSVSSAAAAPAAYTILRPGSGSGVVWMVLAGILVVALGSAGGLALARRR
jgi:hypothetical protein